VPQVRVPSLHDNLGPCCRRRERLSQPTPIGTLADRRKKEQSIELGAFSISLAVKDLGASRRFYEKFGFKVFAGDASQNWLILKNGDHAIGLFQGMFEKNILTFNPGWDSNAQKLASFTDIRDLQHQLKAQGVQFEQQFEQQADESTTGPASFITTDPEVLQRLRGTTIHRSGAVGRQFSGRFSRERFQPPLAACNCDVSERHGMRGSTPYSDSVTSVD
jgi:lactoylglutathione lyase